MKEELTTAMHSEFTISEATEKKHSAFAVFQLLDCGVSLPAALGFMNLTLDDVRPYVAAWNALSAEKIILE